MKRLFLIPALCLTALMATAQERSDAEMASIARRQMAVTLSAKGNRANNAAKVEKKLVEGHVALYDVEGEGVVFVSTDRQFPEVVGYTINPVSNITDMPCCMKSWLNGINKQMDAILTSDNKPMKAASLVVESADYNRGIVVESLVTSKWGQDYPFNSLTPIHNGKNAVTGCVATAFAQILNHNKYPTTNVEFSGSYSLGEGLSVVARVNSTYQWEKFLDVYDKNCPQEEAEIVGALMRDCGYACEMNYSAGSSGAYEFSLLNPLTKYYSYPKESVKYVQRSMYSDVEWYNMIVNELTHNAPILYTGSDERNGGHAFVVDGIDSEGRLSVNWGWTGSFDGYYSMDMMNPSGYKFAIQQAAVIGIRPTALPTDALASAFKGELVVTKGNKGELLLTTNGPVYNENPARFNGKIDIVLEDASNQATKLRYTHRKTSGIGGKPIDGFYGFQIEKPVNVVSLKGISGNLVTGTKYKLYMESQSTEQLEADENLWSRIRYNGAPYFLVEYDGVNLNLISKEMDILVSDAIENVTVSLPKVNTGTYNLSGQKIDESSYRGIVIRNGKKYIK